MTTVIDASAVFAAALEEDNRTVIAAVDHVLANDDLIAPLLLPFEVAGAIAMAGWMKRRSDDDCTDAWGWARSLFRSLDLREDGDQDRHFEICRTYRLRGPDAAYLQLALSTRASLLTSDKKLAIAARAAGVRLVYDPAA